MKKVFLLLFSIILAGFGVIIVNERLAVARLKDVSPVVSEKLPVVLISAEDAVFELQLYENKTAEQFVKQLPQTLVMTRWGDGGYGGSLTEKINVSDDKKFQRRAFFKGEVVFSPRRNALFLMFGATPVALTVNQPMLLSFGGIPVGRLKNYSGLEQLSGVVEFSIGIKK